MLPLPAHLKEIVVPTPAPEDENSVEGKVVCQCGGSEFSLMYPGQTHQYNGENIPCTAEIDGKFFFVLAADCSKCHVRHLLFDADFHGWNGYVCHEKQQASLPRPALVAWACSTCGSFPHRLEIEISGEGIEEFEENAGEEFGLESWPEAFGWLSVSVCCGSCGKTTKELVSYETM